MEVTKKIKELIETPINEVGYILDEVVLEQEGKQLYLRVTIDKEGFITVEDCITVCNLINPILDEADPIEESYILDVCSKEKGCD